jgi:hypothetical protein
MARRELVAQWLERAERDHAAAEHLMAPDAPA